jgi:hypothetical protein
MNEMLPSKLLLVLASTVILGSEFHGIHGDILLSEGSVSLQTLQTLVSLELGPPSLVSTTEKLLDRKVAAPV